MIVAVTVTLAGFIALPFATEALFNWSWNEAHQVVDFELLNSFDIELDLYVSMPYEGSDSLQGRITEVTEKGWRTHERIAPGVRVSDWFFVTDDPLFVIAYPSGSSHVVYARQISQKSLEDWEFLVDVR